jgi:hypothetical protein
MDDGIGVKTVNVSAIIQKSGRLTSIWGGHSILIGNRQAVSVIRRVLMHGAQSSNNQAVVPYSNAGRCQASGPTPGSLGRRRDSGTTESTRAISLITGVTGHPGALCR